MAPDARARAVRQIYASAEPERRLHQEPGGRAGTASGTGFVIDTNGTIVTNAHVVAGASNVQVRFEDKGDGVDAEVLGTDPSSDLAVLRVDPSQHRRTSSRWRSRTPTASRSATSPSRSAIRSASTSTADRRASSPASAAPIKAPNGFSIDKVIQTDAPINPGNSGGPLLDGAGRVIGINSQIATAAAGGGSVGIGFAVPSNTVRQIVPRLRAGTTIRRAYLGVTTTPAPRAPAAPRSPTSSAAVPPTTAGLQVGDTVDRVAGEPIRDPDDISAAIENRSPGDEIDIEVVRDGRRAACRVTLGTRPESTSADLARPPARSRRAR